ncbi:MULTISPECIES: 2-phospho-L-lactate transferase [unclassified Pseudofrankia]|uniref:2-phospho-L-lactate transferase n=1 Tax=unclassified Pseudofrankia TaxID=2994372 RepID=UPI0008DAC8E4|nr:MULTISPECIES: 2-phospho-L-lactate transferase [unclassified Pseudofrankia]MDT3439038.1 2-phospho-L-lactate transferase [Pseudofrankia sp. BMG5.37]OHV47172.1 2-phospho-L-lactate transferase [Pseudofrankia sp. BMG5.36]
MKVTALAGGIGGARFLRGVQAALADADVTVVGNTGDDIILHRLNISPDLDTVMYTLGGGISAERGWGREDETFTVRAELAEYGVGPAWFGLGDRDLATHLVRTQMLAAGFSLSDVTAALCQRWRPGIRLIPMSDDRVETHVVISDEAGRRAIHFQEWWLRLRAEVPAEAIVSVGAADAKPAPGVLDALAEADVVLLPPSNPVVSIGSILSVPGIRDALRETAAPVVGVSPIIGGSPVRGMADACLRAIGVETSAEAVGRHYGARRAGEGAPPARADGLLDGWLVDTVDAGVTVPGVRVTAHPLLMSDLDATVAIVRAALELAGV